MARINLEDSIFKDARYVELCIAAGGRIAGIGALTCLWIEAQKFYLAHGEIPSREWIKSGLPEYLITTGWAERTSTGVRAKGQEEQFAWLRQTQEAGKASAQARVKAKKSAQRPSTVVEENANERSTSVDGSSTSLLLSPSSFLFPQTPNSSSNSKRNTARVAFAAANFEKALQGYLGIRGTLKGSRAAERFADQITSPEILESLLEAIRNYAAFLARPENSWRQPKSTFETFLGTKRSGEFWRDFIALPESRPSQSASLGRNYAQEREDSNREALNQYLASLPADGDSK